VSELCALDGVVCVQHDDVADLYNQVNDPSHANKIVYVPPGTYTLSKSVAAQWNIYGGRLWLRPGMSLIGSNQYDHDATGVPTGITAGTSETVIDGSDSANFISDLTVTDCNQHTTTEPWQVAVTASHRGCLANATVQGAFIDVAVTPLVPTPPIGGWEITVADNRLRNAPHAGIASGSFGCENNYESTLTVLRNLFEGNGLGGGGEALGISNTFTGGQERGTLRVRIEKNRFTGTAASALYIYSGQRGTNNETTFVRSAGNIFDSNFRTMSLGGGSTNTVPIPSSNDTLCFVSAGDTVITAEHGLRPRDPVPLRRRRTTDRDAHTFGLR
jgi:hypothetical protein